MRDLTLLVFTLGPAGESVRRRLLPGRLVEEERALHRRNLETALDAGRANGCRLEVSSPEALPVDPDVDRVAQHGRTFGERFRFAVRGAQQRAPGPLVVIGSDVPELTGQHVAEALEQLGDDRDRVVVGPSPDGGFYLLATNRPLDAELAQVRWCSSEALASLLSALGESGLEVSLLEPLRDLDRTRDLMSWLAAACDSPQWSSWAARLRRLLTLLARPTSPAILGLPLKTCRPAFAGRAPPR